MTNKELIDYCNANWGKVHRCDACPYSDSYCGRFKDKCHDTPYMNDHLNGGKYYTDEVIYMMRTEQEIRSRIRELEAVMKIAITKFYADEYTDNQFSKIYSDIWEGMKNLYWTLGYTTLEASGIVGKKNDADG